jgi:hypothetical protein
VAKIKVTLSEPIEIGGLGKVRSLELRDRVTLGDLLAAEKHGGGSLAQDVFMIARLAGLLPEDLEVLPVEDYEALATGLRDAKKDRAGQKIPPT